MKQIPRISETEWEVMRVIWREHPITANTIIERLMAQDSTWHPKTVRTLLARLVQKGSLDYEAQGRLYVYTPRVSERECIAAASGSFLDRVFGGSLKPLLAHFIEQRGVSPDELKELQALLENAGNVPKTKPKKPGRL